MGKKFFVKLLICMILICAMAFCVTACDKGDENENPPCNHTYVDGYCSKCSEKRESKGLEFKLNSDANSYSVTGIGSCTDTDVVIPQTYKGKNVTAIGDDAFKGCDNLTCVTIIDGITSIGKYAFTDCGAQIKYEENSTLSEIERYAFCRYQGESITIPDTVTVINDCVFYNCIWLKTVVLPDGLTKISDNAFFGCEFLENIQIPQSVTFIGDHAFDGCVSITNLTLGENLTHIGVYAFSGCGSLLSIEIPDGITNIGYRMFECCGSLESITISANVTSIGQYTFYYCTSLETINYKGTVDAWKKMRYRNWTGVPATKVVCSDGEVKLK